MFWFKVFLQWVRRKSYWSCLHSMVQLKSKLQLSLYILIANLFLKHMRKVVNIFLYTNKAFFVRVLSSFRVSNDIFF